MLGRENCTVMKCPASQVTKWGLDTHMDQLKRRQPSKGERLGANNWMWFSYQKRLREEARKEMGREVAVVEYSLVNPQWNPMSKALLLFTERKTEAQKSEGIHQCPVKLRQSPKPQVCLIAKPGSFSVAGWKRSDCREWSPEQTIKALF